MRKERLAEQALQGTKKPKKPRLVTVEELWTILVDTGLTPREAKLQCNLANALGSSMQVKDEWLAIKKSQ